MHRCNFVRGIFGALLSAISVVSSRPDWSLKGNFAVLSACSHELRFQTRPDSSELQTRTTTRSSARKNVANNWQRQTARGDVKLCDGGNRCREDVKNAFPRSDRAVLRCKKMRPIPSRPCGQASQQAALQLYVGDTCRLPVNFTCLAQATILCRCNHLPCPSILSAEGCPPHFDMMASDPPFHATHATLCWTTVLRPSGEENEERPSFQ